MESGWSLLQEIYGKQIMYRGYTIQPYSPKAGTGLSSHEVNQPGSYRDVTDTTIVAQFKTIEESLPDFLKGFGPIDIMAWTTTPWTLPSNTALTVGPKIDDVLVETHTQDTHQPRKGILAKPLVGKQFAGKFFAVEAEEESATYTAGDKKIPHMVVAECKGVNLVGTPHEQSLP